MSRSIRRAAIVAAITVALASLTAIGGATSASGQEPSSPPVITADSPTSFTPTGPGHSMAEAPTASAESARGTSGSANTDATPVAESLITESVIGADGRTQVPSSATSTFPLSAIGQIEFDTDNNPGNGSFICTGWLIDDNSILTSGHCSYDGVNGSAGIIDHAQFFAGRNRENGIVSNPFGTCNVTSVFADDKWIFQGNPNFDYSIQQLDCLVGQTAGHFGIFSLTGTNAFAGRRMRVEGYPGDKPFGGRWMMAGLVHHSTTQSLFYPMDTFGGQSGSPIFKFNRPSCGGPCGGGVHSYGAFGNPPNNSGPRLTPSRINTLLDVADNNGG